MVKIGGKIKLLWLMTARPLTNTDLGNQDICVWQGHSDLLNVRILWASKTCFWAPRQHTWAAGVNWSHSSTCQSQTSLLFRATPLWFPVCKSVIHEHEEDEVWGHSLYIQGFNKNGALVIPRHHAFLPFADKRQYVCQGGSGERVVCMVLQDLGSGAGATMDLLGEMWANF